MKVELLAERLVAYSEQRDWQEDLVVRAAPAHNLYFRFSGREVDTVPTMDWEARPEAVDPDSVHNGGPGWWLASMGFRQDGDLLLRHTVAMPMTIEYARLVAALAVFLIRSVYGVPAEHLVSATLESRPAGLSRQAC